MMLMKLVFCCLLWMIVTTVAEKQIKLEDIERDTLDSEKKAAQERDNVNPSQANKNYLPNPQAYVSVSQTPQYQVHQQPNYIISNQIAPARSHQYVVQPHLQQQSQLYHVVQQPQPQVIPQVQPQYTYVQQPTNNVQMYYTLVPSVKSNSQSSPVQFIMLLQPTDAASFVIPQTQHPHAINYITPPITNNNFPSHAVVDEDQAQEVQDYSQNRQPQIVPQIPTHHYQQQIQHSIHPSASPQQYSTEHYHSASQFLVPPTRPKVSHIRPEYGFIPIRNPNVIPQTPKYEQAEQYINPSNYIFDQSTRYQHEIVSHDRPLYNNGPQSLLDSYIPSSLQLQYLKSLHLRETPESTQGKSVAVKYTNPSPKGTPAPKTDLTKYQTQPTMTSAPSSPATGTLKYINYRVAKYTE